MKRLFAIVALVSASAFAQPAPSAPHPLQLPQPVDRTLGNGLRVIVVPHHEVPLASAKLMIRSGAAEDPADLAGLGEITAELLTQGTTTRSAEQIARGVEALGASIESDADYDESWVDIGVMSPNFAKAMDFVADVVRNPSFKPDEIERMRQQSIDALRVSLQQPDSLAKFVASRVVFGEGPYGHITGGTLESLAKIQRDAIASFHDRYYRPDNAVLVVAGDVNADEVFALAEKLFGSWSAPQSTLVPSSAARDTAPRVVVIDMPDAGQATVAATRKGLRRNDPLYFQAIVANSVLGGGYSSRLNEEIRVKRGLSYGAGSGFELRRDVGPFIASAQTKNESAAEVASLILDQMTALGAADVAESELVPRKAALIGNFARSLETSAGIVDRVSYLALHGMPLDEIGRYVAGVQAITPAQVRQFAKQYFSAEGTSIVIVGDAKKFLPDLKKRFPNVDVIPIRQLDLNAATLLARAPS